MKFDLVIPTYKRPEKLKRLLNSIDANYLKFINIWIYCDNNDYNTYTQLKNVCHDSIQWILLEKQYRAFGIWNYHLKHNFRSDAMIYACDDIRFLETTLMGLYLLWNQIGKDNDIVMGFNQTNLESGSKYAMGIIGKKFAERFPERQYFCPDYKSFYADSESGEYADSIGKFYFGQGLRIHHYHPSVCKKESDETHRIVRDKEAKFDKIVKVERVKRKLMWGKNWTLIRKELQ